MRKGLSRGAGGTLTHVYDSKPERLAAFCKIYPEAKITDSFATILADTSLKMVTAAAIPDERAAIGIDVMNSGKDYFTDKSPFTTLEQLQQVKEASSATGQRYMCYYAERLHNEAAWRAGELIRDGAVGRVLQVLNLAPHRLGRPGRPDWFFQKEKYGGILTDIGSHQVEQFLSYAKCCDAEIGFARVCNFNNPQHPGFEDFGEMSMTGDNGASFYARVDWFTPEKQATWGDGRTFIIGTSGSMEIRKYQDVAREAPASRIFLVNKRGEQEIDCLAATGFPFFGDLILDCLNRTENAMSQAHVYKAAELSMKAQLLADLKNRGGS